MSARLYPVTGSNISHGRSAPQLSLRRWAAVLAGGPLRLTFVVFAIIALLGQRAAAQDSTAVRDSTHGQPPALIPGSCFPPRYPPDLVPRYGYRPIHLILSFVIDTTGRIERNTIEADSATSNEFIEPAIQNVLSCRYLPGRVNGHPVRSRVRQPVNFLPGRR